MFSRLLGVPVLLAAAVSVPYVATNGPNLDGLWDSVPWNTTSSPQNDEESAAGLKHTASVHTPPPQGPGAALYPTATPLEGTPNAALHEIFNLGVTKEWVYQRWARKSTALSELGLYGIRVPLVSGTRLHDLAGSLTYFFDASSRVQRISFRGTTGDSTQLVILVAQRYGLQRQATPVVGEQVYQIRQGNQVFSELRIRPASVLWTSSPHDSFAVELELQRGDAATPLPSRFSQLPVAQASPQEVPAEKTKADSLADSSQSTEKEEELEKPKDFEQTWKAFFPRSRVPSEQVDSLDRRNQIW